MSEFVIRYVSPHGRQEEGKFRSDASRIELSMRAAISIDLTPLQKCDKLERLELSHNFLESIDLKPLGDKETLQVIRLQDNRLLELDLWPLHKCPNLAEIELTDNRLKTLDVTPVFTCGLMRTDSSVVLTADSVLRHILTSAKIMTQFQSVRTDKTAWTATPVVIWNDYDDIALEIGADGVHLGQGDMSIEEAREICGDKLIIGLSTHSVEQAIDADQEDVDYITIGPIYKTRAKDYIVGVEIIKPVVDNVLKPVIAIGGINKDNVDEVLGQGVKSVAVISAVVAADDVRRATSELVKKVKKA